MDPSLIRIGLDGLILIGIPIVIVCGILWYRAPRRESDPESWREFSWGFWAILGFTYLIFFPAVLKGRLFSPSGEYDPSGFLVVWDRASPWLVLGAKIAIGLAVLVTVYRAYVRWQHRKAARWPWAER